jgi:hypothetical protein
VLTCAQPICKSDHDDHYDDGVDDDLLSYTELHIRID